MRWFVADTLPIAAVLCLTLTRPVAAQTRTNFSGHWVLDTAKSDHGPLIPQAMTVDVAQSDDTIKVTNHATTSQGDATIRNLYDLSGRPTRNAFTQFGSEVVTNSTVAWQGEALVITTKREVQGQQLIQTNTWALAGDSASMTMAIAIDVGDQRMAARVVLTRAP